MRCQERHVRGLTCQESADPFFSKTGVDPTTFQLNLRTRVITKADAKDERMRLDPARFKFTKGSNGEELAYVTTRITGRCSRVTHSTQQDRGADVPTHDRAAKNGCSQRNHKVCLGRASTVCTHPVKRGL